MSPYGALLKPPATPGDLYYLPQLIYSEARTSFRKGDVDGARKMLDIIIPYLDLIGDAENAAVIRGWTQRELGVEL